MLTLINKNTPNTTVLQLVISGFVDSREVVNKLNEFYANTGVVVSQNAKYEKPTWFYIAAILNGEDRLSAHSPQDIQRQLAEHGIKITIPSISRLLHIMMNLDESIHPHRRNCGISCYDVVKGLGGLERCRSPKYENTVGQSPYVYYFGAPQAKVYRFRKAYNIYVNP
jgi:hypothetical protein